MLMFCFSGIEERKKELEKKYRERKLKKKYKFECTINVIP